MHYLWGILKRTHHFGDKFHQAEVTVDVSKDNVAKVAGKWEMGKEKWVACVRLAGKHK